MAAPQTVPVPFTSPEPAYPKRVSLPLDDSRYAWLRKIAYESNLPSSAVLRALIDLTRERPGLSAEVIERARSV
jgi:hypothetical protein